MRLFGGIKRLLGNIRRLFDNIRKKRDELEYRKNSFKEMLASGGKSAASGHVKYLGGHPDISGEKDGIMAINSSGVFFSIDQPFDYIFIPVENILLSEFKTGEETAKNVLFSRILAIKGYSYALKKKFRHKHMFLTINYLENRIKYTLLFEAGSAEILANAIAKIRRDHVYKHQKNEAPNDNTPVTERIKQISELRDLGILTEEEFVLKKKELLLRI